uniref:Antiviral protein n=1 Tax=Mycena chlorophos TaxID=658473 RepID=A0ABQ0M2W0_MYCCL|nr:antiviral protein [Mycena chlorophos]
MSLVKSKLKTAREYLAKKQYGPAKDAVEQALAFDPTNYNANVFLGLALLELGDLVGCEQAYRRAIDASPEQLLAWQGLSKYHERAQQWPKYIETLRHLLDLHAESDDAAKCADTIERIIACQREHGTSSELVDALALLLPESPVYAVLSMLPIPDHTSPEATASYNVPAMVHNGLPVLEEVISILEREEVASYDKEIAKRRTRLGAASPEVLRKEVGVEIWSVSRLPRFYNDLLNHPNTTDQLRRATDAKLLRYMHRLLCALPPGDSRKRAVSRGVDELVQGTIALGVADELAWSLALDVQDVADPTEYPIELLQQFAALFPSAPLTNLLKAYFTVLDEEEKTSDLDTYEVIQDAYTSLGDSLVATRIVAEVHLQEEDFQNAMVAAENGLGLLTRAETDLAKQFLKTRRGFKTVLATCLVHLFPPKHHGRALSVIDSVLADDPDNTACLMGRGYILQHEKRWEDAQSLFARVCTLLPEDNNLVVRSREEEAWCKTRIGNWDAGIQGLQDVLHTLKEIDGADADCARCLCRIGLAHWDAGQDSYRFFIASLKYNSAYAPAFSALGKYYLEVANPRDPSRASKCFQKAFELDARETDAARRLADGFSNEREWDLVEVVARRVIDGEGGLDAGLGKSEASRRFLPTNAWAWKAVGVVELARSNFAAAISALQIALRAEPDDQVSWLRLGEAYSKAGRHAAAIKALARAQELDPNDWMCAFFLADVQRQTGQLQEAVDALHIILSARPTEIGVLISLGQAYLELGRSQAAEGFANRAERSFVAAIRTAMQTLKQSAGFRSLSWKTIADALFCLSERSACSDEVEVRQALQEVLAVLTPHTDTNTNLRGIITGSQPDPAAPITPKHILRVAAVACDHRVALGSSESTARASALHDFGIVLLALACHEPSGDAQQELQLRGTQSLTAAVRESPGNDAFWTALGDSHFASQAKTAQHAYIKALELDSKNASTWAKLGLLYFDQGDLELANQALLRAQILDPDCVAAWAGQALVAAANGHYSDSTTLFEHAVTLSSHVPQVDLEYASRTFTRALAATGPSADTLLSIFFVLDRYCRNNPTDPCGLHLLGLVCESLDHLERALEMIGKAIALLEAEYEETESTTVEANFTTANSNIARLRLALRDYDGAIEAFESVLGLIGEDEPNPTMHVQAQFGISLAKFHLGYLDEALVHAERALGSASDAVTTGHVSVLFAQILWAVGDKDAAKGKLLDCIAVDPENLVAINVLVAMGILTSDDGLVDAALTDILSLPVDKRLELDPDHHVQYLTTKHHLAEGDVTKAMALSQAATFHEPGRVDAREDLARLNLQRSDAPAASAILLGSPAGSLDSARSSLALRAVAQSISRGEEGAKARKLAQKAVFLTPWRTDNWRALAFCESC